MNRDQRCMNKKGVDGALKYLNTPCTITEATQIARGVAEDVVSEFSQQTGHLQIAMSLQLEILKEAVINAGIITEDQFRETYIEKAMEFNQRREEALKMEQEDEIDSNNSPVMELKVSDIEVVKD